MDKPGLKDASGLFPGVLTVNKKIYAVNLLWDEVPADRKYRTIIRNRLKLLGSNLFALSRHLRGRQYAIADSRAGHRKKQLVLASCIENEGASLCALCKHDNIWVLLAMDRDGCVITDRAYHDKSEAAETFHELNSQYDWDDIICPSEFGVSGSTERELSSLINRKGVKLYSAGIDRFYPLIAGVACAGVVLACITVFYNNYSDSQKQNVQTVSVESVKPRDFDIPWGGFSLPASFVRTCVDNMAARYLESASIPGWKVDPVVKCLDSGQGAEMLLTAKKDYGLNIWIEDGRYKDFFSGRKPDVDKKGDILDIRWPLDIVRFSKGVLRPEKIGRVEDKTKYLSNTFEYYFIPLQVESAVTVDGGIKSAKFRLSLKQEPTLVLPVLTNVNELIIESVVFHYDSGLWEVEGRFWGK